MYFVRKDKIVKQLPRVVVKWSCFYLNLPKYPTWLSYEKV